MKIGELSSLAGCSVPAVRFYEAEGLLQAPLRAANNYRQYGQQHVDRLAFIVRCRSLDMSHDCPRRSRSEPPYRLNLEPGVEADVMAIGCG